MNLLVLLLTSLACFVLADAHSFYNCQPCRGDECNLQPQGCKYGIARDPCGRLTCMSGPGQRCGGMDNHLGKCGEGMTCMCGKCKGCSRDRILLGIVECDTNTSPLCY